jgi:hypothetical protein
MNSMPIFIDSMSRAVESQAAEILDGSYSAARRGQLALAGGNLHRVRRTMRWGGRAQAPSGASNTARHCQETIGA